MSDVSQAVADPAGVDGTPVATAAVALTVFAGYALACAPTAYLLDSAELAQAGFALGVAHPPGEPLAALWTKLWCLIPLGSVAFRAGLAQAAAGALAAVLVMCLALRSFALVAEGSSTRARLLLAVAAALGFAFAPGVIAVAVRPEVYALETALALGALLAALRAAADDDPRFLLLAALLIGLGLAVHPLVAGLTGVGAAVAALPFLRRSGRVRLIVWSLLALALGALTLVYLPVRAAAIFQHATRGLLDGGDTVAWGDPRSTGGLGWLLSARTFATKAAVVHTAARPYDLPFVLMEELEVVFALLAPVGLFTLLRRPRARLAAAVLGLGWAGSAGAALYGGLDPANPDVRGYLGPAIATTALFSICAIAAGLAPLRGARRWTPALAALLVLGTATRFPAAARYPGLRHATAADLMTGALLGELPPRAALLTAHYESAFLVGYQRLVEGRRPDVAWAHLGFVRGPGYAQRIAAVEPALAPLLFAHQSGALDDAALAALDARHPVRLEPDEHLGRAILGRLLPAGLTWKRAERWAGYDMHPPPAATMEQAAADPQVRGFVAWRAYSDGVLACNNDLAEPALMNLELLHRLLPADERARALAARCARVVEPRRFLPRRQ